MTSAPDWFDAAIAAPVTRGSIVVEGAAIETLAWGEPGRPGLLMIHGNGAHADWWRPFSPFFAGARRVGAFSLSGMGRSGWRPRYDYDVHRKELISAAEALNLFDAPEKPWIVAHSIAGVPALLEAAGENGRRFGGLILADTGYVPNPPVSPFDKRRTWNSPNFATLEDGVARFRLKPAQSGADPKLIDFIARASLTEAEGGGWRWCFDPEADGTRGLPPDDQVALAVQKAKCPLAFIWGERSAIMTPEVIRLNHEKARPGTPFVQVPTAGHHLMLDQPVAFVVALRALLP